MKRDERLIKIMQLMAEYNYTDLDTTSFLLLHSFGLAKGGVKTQAVRYLSYLRSHRYTDVFNTDLLHKRKLHFLTPLGYRILRSQGGLRASVNRFVPSRFYQSLLDHTLALERVGIIMSKSEYVVDFVPEKIARSYKKIKGKFCDAEATIKNKEGRSWTVGIEVQISNKQKETLVGYYQSYAKREDLHRVLWICKNENIIERIKQAAEHHYVPIPHVFTTIEEFEKKGLEECEWDGLKEKGKFRLLERL